MVTWVLRDVPHHKNEFGALLNFYINGDHGMNGLSTVKEIRKDENKIREIEVGSRPGTVKLNIVSIGDPIPDVELLGSFLEERSILLYSGDAHATPEKRPATSPDLVLLNSNRLTFDAQQRVRKAKSKHRVPVICLVPLADAEKADLIDTLGVDDYIFKPFDLHELACRIQVVLRRHRTLRSAPAVERRSGLRRKTDSKRLNNILHLGHSKLQVDDRKKLVQLGDRSIKLTPKEYRLFCLLASEAGRLFSADEIVAHLWKNCQQASVADVQQYIYLLRKKLEPDIHQPKWVLTVKGFGYKLNLATT